MNKSIKKGKSPIKENKIIDSVSATQLLQALHTLENISVIQDQMDEDLNISFSQKDNFNQTQYQRQLDFSESQSTVGMGNRPQNVMNKQQNISQKTGKMNFQFYMSKKENKIKNKVPHQISANKNFVKSNLHKSITPKKTPTQTKLNTHNKSISPLTQRNINSSSALKQNTSCMVEKQMRLKTETSSQKKVMNKENEKSFNSKFQNQKKLAINSKQNIPYLKMDNPPLKSNETNAKKPRVTSKVPYLSIHERNNEFIRKKNEKLAKLCQQIENKKKQQEKQYTFKPTIICNNSHIKSKYNDLCASRDLYDKTHKRCKTGKQNMQNYVEQDHGMQSKVTKNQKVTRDQFSDTLHQSLQSDWNDKLSIEQCESRVKQPSSMNGEEGQSKSMVKRKYKNSKFNILLDLIK